MKKSNTEKDQSNQIFDEAKISLLSEKQKNELDKRLQLFKKGEMEVSSWDKVYTELKLLK